MKMIDLTVKTWRDKVNGNDYVSGRIVLDYGTDAERTYYMPFGYGDYQQAEHDAISVLSAAYAIYGADYGTSLPAYCRTHNIIYRYTHTRCSLRDVQAWGKA